MKTITVWKAEPTLRDRPVESVTLIVAADNTLDFSNDDWQERNAVAFDAQADLIMQALDVLPGGTRDRVLGKLLASKASLFRVLAPEVSK